MQSLVVLALVIVNLIGLTGGNHANGKVIGAWKFNYEYNYRVETRTLTAIPDLGNQYAGIFNRAYLTIRLRSKDILIGRIINPEYAQYHDELASPEKYIPDVKLLTYKPWPLPSSPFKIFLKNGAITHIAFDNTVTNQQANQIKGIISQLQLDLRHQNLIKSQYNRLPVKDTYNSQFKVMEPTITGICETSYDISPFAEYLIQSRPYVIPFPNLSGDKNDNSNYFEVVKTKNYSRCQHVLGYHYGINLGNDFQPGSNQMGDFFSKSSVSQIHLSGTWDQHTIQSAFTTNKFLLNPVMYGNEKAIVMSHVNLTLHEYKYTGERLIKGLINAVNTTLVYSYNIPSDKYNDVREYNYQDGGLDGSDKMMTDRDDERNYDGKRFRKSVTFSKGFGFSSSSSESSSSSASNELFPDINEELYNSVPRMDQPTDTPLLPYHVGYKGKFIRFASNIDIISDIIKRVNEIAEDMSQLSKIPNSHTLAKFNLITNVLSTLEEAQCNELIQALYIDYKNYQNSTDVRDFKKYIRWIVIRDAMSLTGSLSSFQCIKLCIMSGKLKEEEAAQVLYYHLHRIHTPTEEYLKEYFEFMSTDLVKSQRYLNITAVLSYTSLLGKAFVNNKTASMVFPVHVFGYRMFQQKYDIIETRVIPYLSEQLKISAMKNDSIQFQLYTRALGHLAHPRIINVFSSYFEGMYPSTRFQRLAIIVAMDRLVEHHPQLTRTTLYLVYKNTAEYHEIRCMSVYQLFRTNPPLNMLQRMAEFTYTDPSIHVSAAVKSGLESLSTQESSNPVLANNARAAYRLLNPKFYGSQYSKYFIKDYIIKELNAIYIPQLHSIVSQDHIFPSGLFFSRDIIHVGYKSQLSYHHYLVSSIDKLFNIVKRQYMYTNQEQTKHSRSDKFSSKFSTQKIAETLNIKHDEAEKLEGQLKFELLGMKYFIPFDQQSIDEVPQQLKQFLLSFCHGRQVNFTKFYDNDVLTLAFPMETGYPFVYSSKATKLVHFGGQMRYKQEPDFLEKMTDGGVKQANVTGNITIMHSSLLDAKLGFFTPFDHQEYLAGYQKKLFIHAPFETMASLNFLKKEYHWELIPKYPTNDNKMMHVSVVPYTAYRNLLDLRPVNDGNSFKIINTGPIKTHMQVLGLKSSGIGIELDVKHCLDGPVMDELYYQAKQNGLLFSWHWPSRYIRANFKYALSNPVSSKIIFRYSFNETRNNKNEDGLYEVKQTKMGQSYSKESNEKNFAQSDNHEAISRERQQELSKNAGIGIRNSIVSVYDFALELHCQHEQTFIGTVAYANSPVDERKRILLFFNMNRNGTHQQEICLSINNRYPNVPRLNLLNALRYDASSQLDIQLNYGKKCQEGHQITIKSKFERTDNRKSYLQESDNGQYCKQQMAKGDYLSPTCQNLTWEANYFDKWSANVQYNLSHYAKNVTTNFYFFLQQYFNLYSYAQQNFFKSHHKQNQLYLEYQLEPHMNSFNFSIQAPGYQAIYSKYHLSNEYLKRAVTVHPIESIFERTLNVHYQNEFYGHCTVDQRYINTFDNRTYPYYFGRCWHVILTNVHHDLDGFRLVKSMYKEPNEEYAVLMRDADKNQKELMIAIGRKFEPDYLVKIIPNARDYPSFYINDKQQQISEKYAIELYVNDNYEQPFLRVYGLPNGEIKIEIRNEQMQIYYDGYRTRFDANTYYRDYIRGVCGTYNGNGEDDFKTPENCVLQHPHQFVAVWSLDDDETCQGPVKAYKLEAEKQSCFEVKQQFGYIQNGYSLISLQFDSPTSSSSSESNAIISDEYKKQDILKGDKILYQKWLHTYNQSYVEGKESHFFYKSGYKTTNQTCDTEYQYQYVVYNDQYCFTLRQLPVCQPQCMAEQKIEKHIDVFCLQKDHVKADLYRKYIARGQAVDFDKHDVTNRLKFNLPSKCVKARKFISV